MENGESIDTTMGFTPLEGVTDALLSVPGVSEAHVDLESDSATIVSVRDITRDVLSGAISEAGYKLE